MGDTINYTVTVTNTGNVATGEVVLTDTFTGSGSLQGDAVAPGEGGKYTVTVPSAEVGKTSQATYSYVVQANDKEISNAIGTEPGQKTDVTVEDNKAYTAAKSYEISKAEGNTAAGKAEVGDTINYTVTVTNTGNVATGEVVLTDTFTGSGSLQGDAVAPGEGGKYTVTVPSAEVGKTSQATLFRPPTRRSPTHSGRRDEEISQRHRHRTRPEDTGDVTVEDRWARPTPPPSPTEDLQGRGQVHGRRQGRGGRHHQLHRHRHQHRQRRHWRGRPHRHLHRLRLAATPWPRAATP